MVQHNNTKYKELRTETNQRGEGGSGGRDEEVKESVLQQQVHTGAG